jgi:hypothetical protein
MKIKCATLDTRPFCGAASSIPGAVHDTATAGMPLSTLDSDPVDSGRFALVAAHGRY